MILRNWLSASLLARDKIAFQRFAQRWREKGKRLPKEDSEQSVGRGSSTTSKRCEKAEGRSAPTRRERDALPWGLTHLKLPSKWRLWHRLILHFIQVLRRWKQNRTCFLISPQTVPFICLHSTLFVLCSVSVAGFLDKLFSHPRIDLAISIATLSGGENKFAGWTSSLQEVFSPTLVPGERHLGFFFLL